MPTDGFVEARDGVRLAVRDHGGEGRPLLLMHGAGAHLLSLERLARKLLPLRVVTMDQRWSGQSGDSATYSWDDLVSDAEVVIDRLELGNPVLAGHSWGGMIAAFYGAVHPEAPAVINLDGHGSGDPSLYDGFDEAEIEAVRTRLEQEMQQETGPVEGDDEWRARAWDRLRQQNLALGLREDVADEFTERSFLSDGPGRWKQRPSPALMEGLRGDQKMFEVYRSVECPLLVVLAPVLPPVPEFAVPLMEAYRRGLDRAFAELARERPSVTVVTLDDVDHQSIAGRHATVVAAAMTDFLSELGYC